ncbi:substrate-binding domain-containing protein [Gracilibacillus salitolerans]|uniref:substrate-binding domain-containing protein n=1 Tax=Gracilibacillus salitolerans TaxID=2663022 RepID=UPI001E620645|nr:substrate-binding domain-containing protein [Gracilibacillus salitolerans]
MKQGINVPEELRLVGYNGSFVSHMTYPSFPSVVQPYEGLAQQAVSVLYQLMNRGTLDKLTYELDVYMNEKK